MPRRPDLELLAEAERLAQLAPADREAIIAWHRDIAADPKVPRAHRQRARRRADFLSRFMRQLKSKE